MRKFKQLSKSGKKSRLLSKGQKVKRNERTLTSLQLGGGSMDFERKIPQAA